MVFLLWRISGLIFIHGMGVKHGWLLLDLPGVTEEDDDAEEDDDEEEEEAGAKILKYQQFRLKHSCHT